MSTEIAKEKNPFLIAGVDPGLASGALVIVDANDRNRVLKAFSLVEKKGAPGKARAEAQELSRQIGEWSDLEFSAAALRAEHWKDAFATAVDETTAEIGPIDIFAIESFVDQRSRAREEKQRLIKNRWHTPLVMGHLAEVLADRGFTVRNKKIVYQNAGIVIRQWADELALLKRRQAGDDTEAVVSGDACIRNDHQRKALIHALALSLRLRQNLRNLEAN